MEHTSMEMRARRRTVRCVLTFGTNARTRLRVSCVSVLMFWSMRGIATGSALQRKEQAIPMLDLHLFVMIVDHLEVG